MRNLFSALSLILTGVALTPQALAHELPLFDGETTTRRRGIKKPAFPEGSEVGTAD